MDLKSEITFYISKMITGRHSHAVTIKCLEWATCFLINTVYYRVLHGRHILGKKCVYEWAFS